MSQGSEAARARGGTALLLAVAAFAVRAPLLGIQSLWFDEAFSVFIAEFPLMTSFQALMIDAVHPPLYYLLVRLVLLLGHEEVLLRLPSVLFGALTVALVYLLALRRLGRRTALLAATLLLLSPFHIWHSRDARMYSMLAFLATLAMFAFLELWSGQEHRWKTVFVLSSGLAYLTHYFAFLLPLLQLIYLSMNLRRNPFFIRSWAKLQVIASIPSLAWLALIAARPEQNFGIGWIPKPVPLDLLHSFINLTVGFDPGLNGPLLFGAALALFAVVVGSVQLWKKDPFWLLWAFLPPLLIFALSLRRPIYVDRFFILIVPALVIVLAAGLSRLHRLAFAALGIALLSVMICQNALYFRDPRFQKEQWREAADLLRGAPVDETIALRVLQIAVPFQYYSPGPAPLQTMEINRQITALDELGRGFRALWLVYWNATAAVHAPGGNPDFDATSEQDPVARRWISGAGPSITGRYDFQGITIFRFDLASVTG